MKHSIILLFALFVAISLARTPAEWRSRTIYQLLTDRYARTNGSTADCADLGNYCGGTFQGIMNNLDYIKGMGFDAIWISPIPANMPGNYHGYAATDIYEINPYFGTADDLKNLVKACHAKDIWVMIDVVANHMGCLSSPNVFNDKYPFNQSAHYHTDIDCGNIDPNNQGQKETCWLAQLADLNQDNDFVRSTLLSWITGVINTYGIDGLRIDTIPYVSKDFWTEFTQASGVYTVGEVFDSYLPYAAGYQGPVSGILNYPFFYTLRWVFQQYNSMNNLQSYYSGATTWPDESLLGNFVDNHDNARFLYYNGDHIAFKAATAFTLASIGIPIVYYGGEQYYGGGPDPHCREPLWTNMDSKSEMYQYLATINNFRKQTNFTQYEQVQRYSDDNFYAFTRGNYFFAFTNTQSAQVRHMTYHPYADGTVLCNIFWSGDCVTVTGGTFTVTLVNGESKFFAPKQATTINM
jgi:alpha-amylase